MKFLSRPSDKKLHTEGKKRCDGFLWKKRGFKIFFQYIVVAKYGKMSGSWSTLEAFASCSLYNYGCILCLVVAGCGGMEFICSFFVSPCNKCVFSCQHTYERITVKTSLYTSWKWVNLGSHADTKNTANPKTPHDFPGAGYFILLKPRSLWLGIHTFKHTCAHSAFRVFPFLL